MLPIITPGIIAGGIFSFIQSFDDVVLALFLTNIKSRTLPRIMFEGVAHEIDPTIVAISGILIILTIILFSVNIAFSSEKSK
jgi:putative spermidine/putrescine transport system permease protein